MTNSAKTPTGKTKKGQVAVRLDSGYVKACFPRNYLGMSKQLKLATGINPDEWEATAAKLQRRLQLDLEEGKLDDGQGSFNLGRYQDILKEYGLRASLKMPKLQQNEISDIKKEPSLLEIWETYCEYRKHDLKGTVYENAFNGVYLRFIKSALKGTQSEDAIKIRNWLVENRNLVTTKKVISQLSEAYILAMRRKLVTHNPYDGLAEEIMAKGAKGKKQSEVNTETDDDVLDSSKAYTWDEALAILDYIANNPNISNWYSFVKFKLLTGCRTGEAVAFMWCDILWDKQQILIRRNYDRLTKSFYPIKTAKGENELIRVFPMPKDGELWKLLELIPVRKPNDVVFHSRDEKIIIDTNFGRLWRGNDKGKVKGIIPSLIEQGKLTKYLPPYNTRHTFITHQVFDLGRDEKIVSAWCGHGELVSQKHYQDIADRALQINPEISASGQQSEINQLKEQLRLQQEMIERLMREKGNTPSATE